MKEIEELLQIFGAAGHPDLAAALENISKITFYQKGEKLYGIGDIQSKVYLLLDGIIWCYFIDEVQFRYYRLFYVRPFYGGKYGRIFL